MRLKAAVALLFAFVLAAALHAGLPDNGVPDNGLPDNGIPDNGVPDNGLPDVGISPDALINSPLFSDREVHAALVERPLTEGTVNDRDNPLYRIWEDPFSTAIMAYLWADAHAPGSDARVVDASGQVHILHGNLGLAVKADGHGWHRDQPLDEDTARWISAALLTQVNRFEVHNRYSLRASRPGVAVTASSLISYRYKFGTHELVAALRPCPKSPVPITGQADCGWHPHYVGVSKPGSTVVIGAASNGHKILLQVNLGIHAEDPGGAGVVAVSGKTGAYNPTIAFVTPPGGTWNVQWAVDARTDGKVPAPALSLRAITGQGSAAFAFPANEADVFPKTNEEASFSGSIFNLTPRDKNITPGAPVMFPNAHIWLSNRWENAHDYYQLRACSANVATCIAQYEGTGGSFHADRFSLTSFFANYGTVGSCWATKPGDPACRYRSNADKDDEDPADR